MGRSGILSEMYVKWAWYIDRMNPGIIPYYLRPKMKTYIFLVSGKDPKQCSSKYCSNYSLSTEWNSALYC
jgi:hypothetical protein